MNYDNMDLVSDKILQPDGSIVSAVDGSEIAGADSERAQLYNRMPLTASKLLQPDGSIINGYDGAVIAGANAERASLYSAMPLTALRYVTEGGAVIAGVAGGNPVFEWEPSSADFYAGLDVTFRTNDITSLTVNLENTPRPMQFDTMENLTSLSFPNLLTIDEDSQFGGDFEVIDCTALTSVSFPKLKMVGSRFEISGCSNLADIDLTALEAANGLSISGTVIASLDLSSLISTGGSGFSVVGCPNLESIDLSSFVPATGCEYYFNNNALTSACVNAILARFVANTEFVSGTLNVGDWEGTNEPPTGQGITDYNTLKARGVTITAAHEEPI